MSAPPSKRKTLLVTGATGKQGRALISSLLSSPSGAATEHFRILALTRNPSSAAAKAIISQSLRSEHAGSNAEVELVKGDLDDPASIRAVFQNAEGGIWGVFAVLAFPGLGASAEGEEKQGIALADLALEFGVSHFVFSSVERGGEISDDQLILDRAVKVKIERHVKELGTQGLKWTILRPAFFMENFEGTIGKITAAVLRSRLQPTTKIQLIAVEDIGHVAAVIFQNPENYVERIIVVAGDSLTAKEQDEAYQRATGRHLPAIPAFLAKALLRLNSHTSSLISDMERVHRDRSSMEGGHEQVLKDVKEVYPGMMSFEDWVRKGDGKSTGEAGGWNNVSITALVAGKS